MDVSKENKKRCLIITSNIQFDICKAVRIQAGDLVLCADGGWDEAAAAGIVPDAVIGDFDSLSAPFAEKLCTWAATDGIGIEIAMKSAPVSPSMLPDKSAAPPALNSGANKAPAHKLRPMADADLPKIVRLPAEKDETDTLACVKYGLAKGCEDFCIIGGLSGRFDHTFANIQTLSYIMDMGCTGRIVDGKNRAVMLDCIRKSIYDFMFDIEVEGLIPDALGDDLEPCTPEEADRQRRPAVLTLEPVPHAGFAVFSYETRSTGVCIRNARYTLDEAVLTQSFPIGVSNEFIDGKPVEISLRAGRLLIVVSEK